MHDLFTMASSIHVPQWLIDVHEYRQEVFLKVVEPVICFILGPVVVQEEEEQESAPAASSLTDITNDNNNAITNDHHRRLGFLPNYVEDVSSFHETSMSFATLCMLFVIMMSTMLIFASCFYHNQKTSPLFISPRRHRLPKLVPPPLPVDGAFSWVKVCFFLSDEEIINRIGYDSLIFLRFHRLALRCIVKMSCFSFIVLLPLNFTGGGRANASDLKGYVGSLLFTDFLRFTMANVSGGSPRLWVHCFAAYLLTGIVVRELLVEYEAFNSIRHRYLLSREPHLRTVLVTNIPRHLRTSLKITNYFKHVYPNAVKSVIMCQNLQHLESLIRKRHALLSCIEKEVLILCRAEKRKLFAQTKLEACQTSLATCSCLESLGIVDNKQEKLTRYYSKLEELNNAIEAEKKRRKRVMRKMDKMEAGEAKGDIDYILASPFVTDDPKQRKILKMDNERGSYRPPTIGGPRDSQGGLVLADAAAPKSEASASLETIQEHGSSGLRTRSPVAGLSTNDGLVKEDSPDTSKKKKQKAFAKARGAIRQYSSLARDVNFFGRPVDMSFSPRGGKGAVEDHVNEVTDKAFVVMRTFTASTIAIQSMHSSKPGAMNVNTAPEPRDVLWENIYVSKGAYRTRSYIGELLVLLIIAFYVVPVALVSLLVSESALVSSSPRLAQLDEASAFFSSAIAMVQPLCIVGIQQLLPPLFILIGKAEGNICFSEVQMKAFSRYFLFQVVNVFLVTTIAGSIFDTIAIIIENPEAAFEMLGNSLPRMSSFFITFVTIKTFLALGVEMVRTVSLVQSTLRYILFPNATLRTKRSVLLGMRAIDDPG
jgi:hypothetical protein